MSSNHTGPRRRPARVAFAVVAFAALFSSAALPDAAGAANPNRAAVIVETGAETHRVVITFTEDSLTGIQALQRAGADPVLYTFNGQGGAVCRLFGVGRDAGPNCLGGQDGDARYWAYFRAPAGTSSFKYSQAGAGATQVRDGDVEGWRFGTGQAPTYVSLASLLPQGPPPSRPDDVRPVPPVAGVGNGPAAVTAPNPDGATPGATNAPTSSSTLPATGGATGTSSGTRADGVTGSTGSRATGSDDRADDTEAALASSSSDDGGGNSAASLLWVALLLAVIAVAIVVVRRLRTRGKVSP